MSHDVSLVFISSWQNNYDSSLVTGWMSERKTDRLVFSDVQSQLQGHQLICHKFS